MSSSYRLPVVAFVSILLLWVAGEAGFFRAPEGWWYDLMVRWRGPVPAEEARVLLVEVGPGEHSLLQSEWHHLLDQLERLGAAQVAIGFEPAGAGQAFYYSAAEWGNVIFGRELEPSYVPDRYRLREWPEQPVGMTPPFGVVAVPPAEFGIHRRSAVSVTLEKGDSAPTLEAVVAARSGGDVHAPGQGSFLVNFNHGREWLPRVSAKRVLDDGLIPALVVGRAVLIGLADAPSYPGLHAPIAGQGNGLTLLEYQGFALDTLLGNRQIRTMPSAVTLSLMLIVGLASLLSYQWLGLQAGGWLSGGVVAVWIVLGWILLHVLRIWLPVIELATAQVLVFSLFTRFRIVDDRQRLRQSVLARAAQVQEGVLPPGMNSIDDPWAPITSLVDQVHEFTRFVFLEAIPGDHRLRQVASLHCAVEDIEEPGRDYESAPYSAAIARGGPVRLEERPFLKPLTDGPETQYLVPLIFDGEVQGVWAFGVAPDVVEASSHFISRVEETAAEIAGLLYQRRHWLDSAAQDRTMLWRILHGEAQDRVHREVEHTIGSLDRQLQARRSVLDGIGTAIVLYDLFGRVVQLNRSMEEFMRAAGLRVYDMTALELLVKVSGLSTRKGRAVLQRVIGDGREFHVPVLPRMKKGEQYSVTVRPVAARKPDEGAAHSPAPFQLKGILFEFVDITRVAQLLWPKGQMLERLQWRLRNDLEALSAASFVLQQSLSGDRRAVDDDRQQYALAGAEETDSGPNAGYRQKQSWAVDLIEAKIEGIRSALEHHGPDLDEFAGLEEPVFYPSNLQAALVDAVRELTPAATLRDIRFEIEQPAVVGLVQARPQQLGQLLKAVLTILLGDAGNNTTVYIEIAEREGLLEVDLYNTGFGIPDERFQAYLQDPDYPAADEFRQLREAVRPVEEWGGELELHSEVGVGMWGVLRLPLAS